MDITKSIDDLFSAKDLVVVITGGGSGIGLAFASALAKSHASKVFLLGRRLQVLEDAASSIDSSIVKAIKCDVTSPSSIANAVRTIEKETSYVDVLINNAGVTGPDHSKIQSMATIQDLQACMLKDWEQWNTTYETNTASVVAVSAAFLHLLDNGNNRRGWIRGRKEMQKREENYSGFNRHITASLPYTATKAAATMLGKSLATLLAPFGIRSNVIAPGRFPSEMTLEGPFLFPVNQIPHGCPGEYGDMAGTILYLVGKAGSYVNGNVQVLDGGRLSVMPATY